MLEIFIFSFVVALTGALSPGPLLTFTINKSLQSKKGYLAGLFIVFGHALLEFVLIIALLLGVSLFFQNLVVLTVLGLVGGVILFLFGILTIKSVFKEESEINFSLDDQNLKNLKGNSFIGGIVVSLSNPYWTLWWAVVGLGFMINFNVNFENPLGILLFFLGHELGDLIWYVPISSFVYFGGKALNPRIYKIVLIISSLFMIGFGIYLSIRILIFPPEM